MAHYCCNPRACSGSSSALNCLGARAGAELRRPHERLAVVTVLDGGARYLSRFWNREFVEKGVRWPRGLGLAALVAAVARGAWWPFVACAGAAASPPGGGARCSSIPSRRGRRLRRAGSSAGVSSGSASSAVCTRPWGSMTAIDRARAGSEERDVRAVAGAGLGRHRGGLVEDVAAALGRRRRGCRVHGARAAVVERRAAARQRLPGGAPRSWRCAPRRRGLARLPECRFAAWLCRCCSLFRCSSLWQNSTCSRALWKTGCWPRKRKGPDRLAGGAMTQSKSKNPSQ